MFIGFAAVLSFKRRFFTYLLCRVSVIMESLSMIEFLHLCYLFYRVWLRCAACKLLQCYLRRVFCLTGKSLALLLSTKLLQHGQTEPCQEQPQAQQPPLSWQRNSMSLTRTERTSIETKERSYTQKYGQSHALGH